MNICLDSNEWIKIEIIEYTLMIKIKGSIMHSRDMKQERGNSFIRIANKKYNKFDYSNIDYINTYTKVIIGCPIHGKFSQTPDSHLNSKYGCPKCGADAYNKKIRTTKEIFLKTAIKAHGDKYNYDKVIYTTMTNDVEIECPKHGSFWQQPILHANYKNNCPKCVIENGRLTNDVFISRCKKIHNDKYDYSNTRYVKLYDDIEIGCPIHGSFTQQARIHIDGSGCIKCHNDKTVKGNIEFIKESINLFGNIYTYDKVDYKNNKTPVIITCKKHGDFNKRPQTHLYGSGCPKCIGSSGERILSRLLEKYKINYIREYRIEPYRYRFDFYIPDANIYIEFNGIQHYHPVEAFGGKKTLIKTKRNDQIKKKIVKDSGGVLITISYRHFKKLHTGGYLTQRLKSVYKYWYMIDNKLRVFRELSELKDEICLLNNKLF